MEKIRVEEEVLEILPEKKAVIKEEEFNLDIDYSKYGFRDEDAVYEFVSEPGLSSEKIILISKLKNEPIWMTEIRLKAYEIFLKKHMPNWGVPLDDINFDEIVYYVRPTSKIAKSWDEVPEYIRRTYEKLGIPEAERKYLGGVEAQYDSEVVYSNIRKDLEEKGVIFLSMDEALKQYPHIVKEYFGTVVPASDNKFAALNTAVWSGGSFVYVPKGVRVDIPLQAYFRINYERFGQFERTLIIAEEGSYVHYIEGCTAPIYDTHTLHAAVVEVIVKEGAHVRYTTIQNWSKNVLNLVTKRAKVYKNGFMEWISGELGSGRNMKYPGAILIGENARADILSMSFASANMWHDTGGKIIIMVPNCKATITSKSISKGGGISTYRGLVQVHKDAENAKISVSCDALIMDDYSTSNTYPYIEIEADRVNIAHEAKVGKIGEEQIFYLMSRGLSEKEAMTMIVMGFIEPLSKELPMEYAIELNRLIELEMEGSVG